MYTCLKLSCHQELGDDAFTLERLFSQMPTHLSTFNVNSLSHGQPSTIIKSIVEVPAQVNLSSDRPTNPATPGFGWDRAKTSGLHHIIPLLSDHNIYMHMAIMEATKSYLLYSSLASSLCGTSGEPAYGRTIISPGQAPICLCHDVHGCE
jgi:hypothetical protein